MIVVNSDEFEVDHLVSNAGITSISMVEEYDDITKARAVMVFLFSTALFISFVFVL